MADGDGGRNWNPGLNGTVNDVDAAADGTRVYAAGYFGTARGVAAKRAAAISTATGANLAPQFNPTWSASKDYQRAVEEIGNRVYFGGSEHSLFGFNTANMQRVSGSITKRHGDVQAVDADAQNNVVYAGCHCQNYSYENAFTWSTLSAGWTEADAIQWVGAWTPQPASSCRTSSRSSIPVWDPECGRSRPTTGATSGWAVTSLRLPR